MHVVRLSLHDFRSYAAAEVVLAPGVTWFVGRNGQGKTNLVEAVDYVARLSSHRVASDAPLVRLGAEQAVIRVAVVRDGREALLEVEINPGRSNRARINKSPLPRSRDMLGLVRTVLFSPEDLTLVKGDPSDRRRFLDDLLVQRAPRYAGIRADYDRVLRQRNALLKTARDRGRRAPDEHFASTLEVWNQQLATVGTELLAARLALVADLEPLVGRAYETVALREGSSPAHPGFDGDAAGHDASLVYRPSFNLPPADHDAGHHRETLRDAFLLELERRRAEEVQRGVSLVGPHRDELVLALGPLPVKGYASHGESWSFALALRLASYDLLRSDGDDPILILDDVFAELDAERRERLAELVAGAEQVLVTAAVAADVPEALRGRRIDVVDGQVAVHAD